MAVQAPIIKICNALVTPCPTRMLLSSYITGRLKPEHRQLIEHHLIECSGCRSTFIPIIHTLSDTEPYINSYIQLGEKAAAAARLLSTPYPSDSMKAPERYGRAVLRLTERLMAQIRRLLTGKIAKRSWRLMRNH